MRSFRTGRGPVHRYRTLLSVSAWAAAAVASGTAVNAESPTEVTPRPNIVVVMTDDQSLANQAVMQRTNELVGGAAGTTFDNAVVSFPLCCPSRATFLTGQHSHNHGVVANVSPNGGYCALDHSQTVPVWLDEAGYFTAQVGKYMNHYGRCRAPDVPPGWDDWFGWVSAPRNGLYYDYTVHDDGTTVSFGADERDYSTDVFARHAVDVIRRQAGSPDPFFLLFQPHAPHSTDPVPAARHAGSLAGLALPRTPSFNELAIEDKPTFVAELPLLRESRIAVMQAAYERRVESLLAVDEAVAAIVRTLRSTDQLDNTVIIFTSDNGFLQGEHRVDAGKVRVYEESIRVPLLVSGGPFPAGATATQLVGNVDLAPTIVELAGAVPGHPLDGRSLVPIAQDPAVGAGRHLLIETTPAVADGYAAVRTPNHVYVEYGDGQRELYDLRSDPYQLENRAADPAYEEIRRRLERSLSRLRACSGTTCQTGS